MNLISRIWKRGVEGSSHPQIFFNLEFKINYSEYFIYIPQLYVGYRLIYWYKLGDWNCSHLTAEHTKQSLNCSIMGGGNRKLCEGHIRYFFIIIFKIRIHANIHWYFLQNN